MKNRSLLLAAFAFALLTGCGSSEDSTTGGDSGGASVKVDLPPKAMSGSDLEAVEKAVATPAKLLVNEGSAAYFGIWDPKKGSFEKAYGKASKEGPAATTEDFIQIGSVTKTFTATVILQLVEEGRLALSETVAEADPELAEEFKPLADLTIEELISMHSGIPPQMPSS